MIVMPTALNVPLRLEEGDGVRIGNTRVTLQAVIADFHRGASPEEIAHHYSALNLSDAYLIVGYYLQNRLVRLRRWRATQAILGVGFAVGLLEISMSPSPESPLCHKSPKSGDGQTFSGGICLCPIAAGFKSPARL
jgi:uncharacterized protein (DUF433 family)